MTLARRNVFGLAAVVATFALAMVAFLALNSETSPPGNSSASVGGAATAADRVRQLEAQVQSDPGEVSTYALLADAYLQRVRESGDPAFYERAQTALTEGRRRDAREPGIETASGSLALARHDFAKALGHGEAALRLAPDTVRPLGVIADAQIELGRYAAAERTLQRMVDLKPTMASYARVSYYRELTGDLSGAAQAMRLAISAGGEAVENVAYLEAQLGGIELHRGQLAAAKDAYGRALYRLPSYAPAEAGLARVDAARGRLEPAIERLRPVVARLPLPEYAIQLGEYQLAAGRRAEAKIDLSLVGAQRRLLESAGVNVDAEIAVYEADHGSPQRAVELARRAYAAAPSVRSADALGWALTRAGSPDEGYAYARRALRIGWRDPLALYHAGMAARAVGRTAEGRTHLRRALDGGLAASPLHATRARHALRSAS